MYLANQEPALDVPVPTGIAILLCSFEAQGRGVELIRYY